MKRRIAAIAESYPWFKSIFDYYKAFRIAKAGVFFHRTIMAPDGYPVPGPTLLIATTGNPDPAIYLESGLKAKDSIMNSLSAAGVDISTVDSILDFGCGCGRVLRQWATLQTAEIHGVDIDRKAVRWCIQNLPFAQLNTCGLAPPLSYASGSFNLVYALSVLTHLPEDLQRGWIREWHRILRPAGLLLFSVHGDHYKSSLTDAESVQYDQGELVLRNPGSAGSNRCGAFHPKEFVLRKLTEGFEVLQHIPSGALGNPSQDLYLLQKVV